MATAILGRCPGCKRTLRLPEEAAGKTVRCRHCGIVSQANPTAKLAARQAAAKAPPVPAAVRPTPVVPMATPIVAQAAGAPFDFGAPAAAPPQGDAWAAIAEETYGATNGAVVRPRRRGKGGWVAAVLALFFLAACLGGTAAAVYFLMPKIREKIAEQEQAQNGGGVKDADPAKVNALGNQHQPVVAGGGSGAFPRRLLGISVNNYIYANPTSYGFDGSGYIKRDFGKTLEKLANKLRIPETQVLELSDGAPKKPNPPLKPIIEQTLTRFAETSRPQDRVIVVLSAHTIEIEKKPYLVPLEGDIDDAKTLIPLEWIMQQLDKCPAQQKVLIADFNRYDKGRGKERPSGGKLAESTEAMLKNPPAGVQVWSASSAGQYSYEFDDYYGFQSQGVKGGAFLCMFSVAFLEGLSGKIQKPEDPLPIDLLASKVNKLTEKLSMELEDPDGDAAEPAEEKKDEKKKDDKKMEMKEEKKPAKAAKTKALQTPFLAGSMKGEPVAYNAAEPAPKPVAIPTPQEVYAKGVVPEEQIKKMLDVFALPPLKEARRSDNAVRFDKVLPFSAEAMKDYKNPTPVEEIKKNPDKYPLRTAVVNAIEKLRKLDSGELALPTELRGEQNDAAKANFARLQRGPARVLNDVNNVIGALTSEKIADSRKEEKSKFWQATYDYVLAQAKARYVYVMEYDSVIGLIRKDGLPELDVKGKGHVGWKLAAKESLSQGTEGEAKEMYKEVRNKLYTKIAKDYAGTPWAILAKREKYTALGLRWEPYAENKTEQAEAAPEKK
jgi:hypothetical protein